MNLCSKNHEEICFETRNCPACGLISDHKTEVETLKAEISDLENQVASFLPE